MTLIIALPASDGITLATDAMLNFGGIKERTQKIFRLTNRACWTATGELALIQRVSQQLAAFQESPQTLKELLPAITNIIKGSVRDLLAFDFRAELFMNNPGALAQLHRADFVFCEWANSPITLHLSVVGTPEWVVDRAFLLGPGDTFAGSLYQKYRSRAFNLHVSSMLAYRLLDETIETGMFGIGAPVDIWQVSAAGVKQLDDTETGSMRDALKVVRDQEAVLFEKHLTLSAPH